MRIGVLIVSLLVVCLLTSCNICNKGHNKMLITDDKCLRPVENAGNITSRLTYAPNVVDTSTVAETSEASSSTHLTFDSKEEEAWPDEQYCIFKKHVDSLDFNIIWIAYFEPKEDDVEYKEFIKWSRKYLLNFDYGIHVDTSIIESWNDIITCNANCTDELLNNEEIQTYSNSAGINFDRNVVLNRNKTELYSNYTIMIETYGDYYGRGQIEQYTALFDNSTGERFAWDCIANIDGLLSKIEKQYVGGYMEDSECWINTDTLVTQMKKQKPRTDPYLRMEKNELYLCLYYQWKEIYPGYEIPFQYEVSFPIDSVILFLSERGKKFIHL